MLAHRRIDAEKVWNTPAAERNIARRVEEKGSARARAELKREREGRRVCCDDGDTHLNGSAQCAINWSRRNRGSSHAASTARHRQRVRLAKRSWRWQGNPFGLDTRCDYVGIRHVAACCVWASRCAIGLASP